MNSTAPPPELAPPPTLAPPTSLTTPAIQDALAIPRFPQWIYFLIFSVITLFASVGVDSSAKGKWAVACSAMNFTTTLIVILLHIMKSTSVLIIDTKVEGGVIGFLVLFSSIRVGLVTGADSGIAVDSEGAVSLGNLYYFSWAALFSIIFLAVSYLRSVFGVDIAGEIRTRSARLDFWSAMLISSLTILWSCGGVFADDCVNNNGKSFCRRTMFGIFWGLIGTLVSLGIVGMKISITTSPFLVEVGGALLVLVFNILGVIFITGSAGPGAAIGNLYYFPWMSLLLSFKIAHSCYDDYHNATNGDETTLEDIKVESLDDDDI